VAASLAAMIVTKIQAAGEPIRLAAERILTNPHDCLNWAVMEGWFSVSFHSSILVWVQKSYRHKAL
jgi:hypothetical protein